MFDNQLCNKLYIDNQYIYKSYTNLMLILLTLLLGAQSRLSVAEGRLQR